MYSSVHQQSSLVAADPRNFKVGSLTLDIISVGGHYTCIQIPKKKIIVDMGLCPKNSIRSNHVFFTHPHPDHMSAVIQHLSTREMLSLKKGSYFLEEQHKENFVHMIEVWRKMSRCTLECNIIGLSPEQKYNVTKNISVLPFRSVHRIPCMGYTFFEQKKKLLPMYQKASTEEIIHARKQNKIINSIIEKPFVSITGDTTHHVFAQNPSILNSEVIITEVTFFCNKISSERAQHQGHMHIDDLKIYEEQLSQTNIVIMHLSARYTTTEVEKIIHNKFSKEIRENIIVIPNKMSI